VNQPFRLFAGGRIDRDALLPFRFNGVDYTGFAGDTLASALLACGVHRVGRSFKYHRLRGILSAGSEEPNALVQLEQGAYTQPNLRATQVELYAGLSAASQNCWPSLDLDVGAVNSLAARLIPAGFYYKTFMWPRGAWMRYEQVIRRAAGLGRAPRQADPDIYDKMHVHCDVLVVGAGPSGLAAAVSAARSGARVMLMDEQAEPGGDLLDVREPLDGAPAEAWVASMLAELDGHAEVTVLPRTTVVSYFDHNYLVAVERRTDHLAPGAGGGRSRQRLWKVRARQVVLATGAHERPLVFRNNDLPGVMLAGAARRYANRYAVRAGDRAVVFTNNDEAWLSALDLSDAGVEVSVVDARARLPEDRAEAARARGITVLSNHVVTAAKGRRRVRGVQVAALDARARGLAGGTRDLPCDLLCMSGGWNPVVHLFSQSRGKLRFDEATACFVPEFSVQSEASVGAANGSFDLAAGLREGARAGEAAAASAGFTAGEPLQLPQVAIREEVPLRPLWQVPCTPGGRAAKHFVDFQNDVTAADLQLAAREGYLSVEHAKRYTTTGMGTDQGKTSNVNGLAILGQASDRAVAAVGTTTFRPPYTPVTFGALAGRDLGALMDPVRRSAMYDWHVRQGALFEDVGQWKRPWYYPRPGEGLREAVARECVAARTGVGILDASTLGKIELEGPDTVTLLNRLYTNGWSTLKVGRARYGLMCTDDGMVFDDGVTVRLDEDRFLMHTTSGNAARVLAWIEEWLQTEWPELRVYANSVTEQWATAAISGPRARELLSLLCRDVDLDPQAFPFMSWRAGTVAGIPARIMRVSFTGELCFEINVAADYGLSLWTALMTAGAAYGITPFGTETMHVLRAEKGFIIAGQETDGTVTPVDLGLGKMVSQRKDFIGKRSLDRVDTRREDRKQLVGLRTERPQEVLPEGAQIVSELRPTPPMTMIGHVTSSYWSENLGHSIALALVKGGRARLGEMVQLPLERKVIRATVCSPVFFDPQGERMNG
jgi:sarcosine oxidase subunit alpha